MPSVGCPDVVPWTDHQVLGVACSGVKAHPLEVRQRAGEASVLPASERQRRNLDARVFSGSECLGGRRAIATRVRSHLTEARTGLPEQVLVDRDHRPMGQECVPVEVWRQHSMTFTRSRAPGQRVLEHEDAAEPSDLVADVRRAGAGRDRLEVSRTVQRGTPWVGAGVGGAPHADAAIAERLCGQPFDRVEAVRTLVHESLELTLRITFAPTVGNGRCVATREPEGRLVTEVRAVWAASVRSDLQHQRPRDVSIRCEHVGRQRCAVAQWNADGEERR